MFAEVVKEHICLLPKLFENIQDKSLEMFWIIPHKSIQSCLSSRDALYWESIDIRTGSLDEKDLMNIAKSDIPLKRLSFQTLLMTDGMFDVIEKFSSTIEVLEINFPWQRYSRVMFSKQRLVNQNHVVLLLYLTILRLTIHICHNNKNIIVLINLIN